MDNLIGITYGMWRQLRREVHDDIDAKVRPMTRQLALMSLITSWKVRGENRIHGEAIARTEVPAPVFVLGHWRSGTTVLHTLLTQDEQFSFPRMYQVSNPHTFLGIPIERVVERQKFQARKRAMDNIQFDIMSPAEDEFATCPMSIRSHMISWSFPRQEPFYDRFLTFRQATPEEYEPWRKAFLWFLKKIIYKEGARRPLLKSPQHTARVGLLLKEFPEARFIHIHRNPYPVYRSTERLYKTGIMPTAFQQPPNPDFVTAGVLRRYSEMHDAFFEDRQLIPEGQYVELAFEDFEQDMLGSVAHIYERLRLDGYAQAEPKFKAHLESIKGYRKNEHTEIEEGLRQRIYTAWRRCFDEWGYQA
jgi:omega-hydroxy-beta-dihydromenaquinone-9 sulfotransferase